MMIPAEAIGPLIQAGGQGAGGLFQGLGQMYTSYEERKLKEKEDLQAQRNWMAAFEQAKGSDKRGKNQTGLNFLSDLTGGAYDRFAGANFDNVLFNGLTRR
jgi:hypothetical protein